MYSNATLVGMSKHTKSKKRNATPAYIRRFNKVAGLCARLGERTPKLADVVMTFATKPPAARRRIAAELRAVSPDVSAFVDVLEAVAS